MDDFCNEPTHTIKCFASKTAFVLSFAILDIILGTWCAFLNGITMTYYKKKLNDNVNHALYYVLTIIGMVIGAGALAHATLLVLTLSNTVSALKILIPICYTLILLGAYISTMINVCLAVVRTINIIRPLRKVRPGMVLIAIVLYGVFYVFIAALDIYYYNIQENNLDAAYYYEIINMSGGLGTLSLIHGLWSLPSFLVQAWVVPLILFLVPCILPSLLCLVCAIIQIVSLQLRKKMGREEFNRRITITILLITITFFVCNTATFTYGTLMASLQFKGGDHYLGLYFTSAMFPIINTLINPIILIVRGRPLRRYVIGYLTNRGLEIRESMTRGPSIRGDGVNGSKRMSMKGAGGGGANGNGMLGPNGTHHRPMEQTSLMLGGADHVFPDRRKTTET